MVAMFSFFYGAAEPLFNNCFSQNNAGYDYLMFSAASPHQHVYVCHKKNDDKNCVVTLPPKKHKLTRTYSTPNAERTNKAASEPPFETCSIGKNKRFPARRHTNSFHKTNSVVRSGSKIKGDQRGQGLAEVKTNGFGRFLRFFESLNPLNGFKDRDEFEEYLYGQSYKVEPKNGEIPNPKPKHSPEALKSPGIKLQKTPTSGNTLSHRISKGPKSSISSPRSPNIGANGGNLLSPSHINVPTWSSPPSGSSTNSPASLLTAEEQNFAIVDINPGQFPRWLADTTTSGRVNPAFISEYVSTSALLPNQPHSLNESPTSPSPNMINNHRRRPPLPLGVGESHFVFPSPLQQQHYHFRKPPAPPPPQTSDEQSPSFLSPLPTFALAKPPATRKKLPALDPQNNDNETAESQTAVPPKLPPRLNVPIGISRGGSSSQLSSNSPEATAPPRPPKKVATAAGKSPQFSCENQQQPSPSQLVESEASAPPLPPKPKTLKR